MVGIVAAGLVFWHPSHRRRSLDTDAAGPPIHIEPGPGDLVPSVLVLDVGCAWSNPRCPDAGDSQDRLRSRSITKGLRPFSGGLSTD